jgi:hypothetical protein
MKKVFYANGNTSSMKILTHCDVLGLATNGGFYSFVKPIEDGWVISELKSFGRLDSLYQAKLALKRVGWLGSQLEIENIAHDLWEEKNRLDYECQ